MPFWFRTFCFLVLPAAACGAQENRKLQPRVKWLYASFGIYLDQWGGAGEEGDGLAWKSKDRAYNPPQSLYSLTLGGGMAITRKLGLSVALPFFHNRIDAYTNTGGFHREARSETGMGDVDIGLPMLAGPVTVQPRLAVPGPYQPEYLEPWTGFGVYRGGVGAAAPWRSHYFWGAWEWVLYQPGGDFPGLVEAGDFVGKGGYAYKGKFLPRLAWKTGVDLSYSSLRWAGDDAQTNFSADPKVSLAFLPRSNQEASLNLSATLYSRQGGSRLYRTYGSRKIFLGVHYGFYR